MPDIDTRVEYLAVNENTAGDHVLVQSRTQTEKIVVLAIGLWANSGPTDVTFKSGTTEIFGPIRLAADGDGGGYSCREGLMETSYGENLVMATTGLVRVSGGITFMRVEKS